MLAYRRNGEEGYIMKELREVTQETMDAIATYMDDEKREKVHNEYAPCTPETFLREYLKEDPEFESLLNDEFGIEV